MPPRPVELLTVPEFLARARVSRSVFYHLIRRGVGPPITKIGKRTFIDRAAGDDWIRAQTTGRPAGPPARPSTGGTALSQTSTMLRALAPHKNLCIALELVNGPRTLADVCRSTGLPEQIVRQVLPAMQAAVALSSDPDGRTVLSLNSPQIACLVDAIRKYHDEI